MGLKVGEFVESEVLVLEDVLVGVKVGKVVGFKVVVLVIIYSIEKLKDVGVDWIVKDMRSVMMKKLDVESGKIVVEIKDVLKN